MTMTAPVSGTLIGAWTNTGYDSWPEPFQRTTTGDPFLKRMPAEESTLIVATASRARLSLDIVKSLLRVLRRRRCCIEYPGGLARRHTAAHVFSCDVVTYAMGIDKVEPSDAELVRRVRAGDIGAYGAL